MFADYSKPEALEKPFASWTEYAFFAWNKQFGIIENFCVS